MPYEWQKIADITPLGFRSRHAACADSTNDRLFFFGGLRGGRADTFPIGDTWVFDRGIWKQNLWTPAPPPLQRVSMAFDSKRGVAVLFGGQSKTPAGRWPLNRQTWEFDGSRWRLRTPRNSPLATCSPAMCFHPGLGMIVLFGGSPNVNMTWVYDGTEWEPWEGDVEPTPREYAMMAYDPVRETCILFGGTEPANGEGTNHFSDTWEFDAQGWRLVDEEAEIGGHADCGFEFHPASKDVVFLGSAYGASFGTFTHRKDGWHAAEIGAAQPSVRQCGSLLSNRGVLIANAGEEYHNGPMYSDMWQLHWTH